MFEWDDLLETKIAETREAVEAVREAKSDPEAAHAIRDRLFVDVLMAINEGRLVGTEAEAVVRIALEIEDMTDLELWYA